MKPPPVRDDADAIRRTKVLTAKLRALNCPASAIPASLIAEGDLLRAYLRRRVGQETARVDQAAAGVLDAIEATVLK